MASENALLAVGIGNSEAPPVAAVLEVAAAVDAIVQGFLDLFGGDSSPPKPYQERGGRHPAIDRITGIAQAWTPSEASAAPSPGDWIVKVAELRKRPETPAQPTGFGALAFCNAAFMAFTAPAVVACGVYGGQCFGGVLPACIPFAAAFGYEVTGFFKCLGYAYPKSPPAALNKQEIPEPQPEMPEQPPSPE